jgi:hypothetical protein
MTLNKQVFLDQESLTLAFSEHSSVLELRFQYDEREFLTKCEVQEVNLFG